MSGVRRQLNARRAGGRPALKVAALTRDVRRLETLEERLALPFILATYFPHRWSALRVGVQLPLRGDDWRRLVDAAMDELPTLFPVYEVVDAPDENLDEDGYQLYHDAIPVLGPELYCPFRDGHDSPAELLLYGLCRPDAGEQCCTACTRFTLGDVLADLPGSAATPAVRARLARLVRRAEEEPGALGCAALARDAGGVFAAQAQPWRDVPDLARLIGRQTGCTYLDVDMDTWDEGTQRVAWTFRDVSFFAREYAAAHAYRARLRPLHAALADPDGLAHLVGLLTLASRW